MRPGWNRYKTMEKCPICGHGGRMGHGSGCTYSGCRENPSVVLCRRVSDGGFAEAKDGQGWIHRLRDEPYTPPPRPIKSLPPPRPRMKRLAAACSRFLSHDEIQMEARSLGVSTESLIHLEIGWSRRHRAFTFPMRSGDDTIIGVRLRSHAGRKWAIHYSQNGMFIPRGLPACGPLFLVEGPTETAAMLDMGFATIGRPSNTGGTDFAIAYVLRYHRGRPVVILRNNDPAGSDAERLTLLGAKQLKRRLWDDRATHSIRIVAPPQTKDVRDWRKQGCTAGDIWNLIDPNEYSDGCSDIVLSPSLKETNGGIGVGNIAWLNNHMEAMR